jgi:hypothetical protein
MGTQTTRNGDTKHAAGCKRVFAHYDAACPRCAELMAGATARTGWQGAHFAAKAQRERMDADAIKSHFAIGGAHDCGACGPVCTFGDW